MAHVLIYRWCFGCIYHAVFIKRFNVFTFINQNIKEKVVPKVFGIFKNGQKKCPKMKMAEILWENQHL
jgi:hypothetical protein